MSEGCAADPLGHWETSSAHRDGHAGTTSRSQGWPMSQIQECGGHHKREGVWIETMVMVVVGDAAAHDHTCSAFPHPVHS